MHIYEPGHVNFRPLLYGFVELMRGVQGVYIFLFFKYADNVVRFVKLVHQIY